MQPLLGREHCPARVAALDCLLDEPIGVILSGCRCSSMLSSGDAKSAAQCLRPRQQEFCK